MQTSRTLSVNGIELFVREQGEGPLVLLCHGWPELSYSWRHQIGALADAGFHVVAPDMRGFGRTSAPAEIDAYSIFDLVGDMVALVAALGDTARGHRRPRLGRAGRLARGAVPARPVLRRGGVERAAAWRGKARPLEALRQAGITNFYWQYFQTPGVAEAEFERDVALTMRAILGGGFSDPARSLFVREGGGFIGAITPDRPLPDWLTEDELAEFVATYRATRFSRRAELVSQHRPQLGADRAVGRRADPSAVAVHRRRQRPGDFGRDERQAARRDGAGAAEADAQADHPRRRPLDPAGASRRGQRGADRISEKA